MLYDKLMNSKGALAAVVLSMLLTGSLFVEAARKKTVTDSIITIISNCCTMKSDPKNSILTSKPYLASLLGRLDMNSVFLLVMQVSSATTW